MTIGRLGSRAAFARLNVVGFFRVRVRGTGRRRACSRESSGPARRTRPSPSRHRTIASGTRPPAGGSFTALVASLTGARGRLAAGLREVVITTGYSGNLSVVGGENWVTLVGGRAWRGSMNSTRETPWG
jgi:hypothetical protein